MEPAIPAIDVWRKNGLVSLKRLSLPCQFELDTLLYSVPDSLEGSVAFGEEVFKDQVLFGVPEVSEEIDESLLVKEQSFFEGGQY